MISSAILFFILIGLYPVIFFTSKNWFIYQPKQLLFLLIFPVITGGLGTIIAFLAKQRLLISFVGLCLFYLFFSNVITASKVTLIGFIAAGAITLFLTKRTGFRFINLVLLIMSLFASAELIYSVSTQSIKNDYFLPSLNKQLDDRVKFKATPNIYFIHLESYHSPRAMKRLYNFDNQEFINELESKDFFVSQNNFSNYNSTLYSIGGMFLQQQHYFSRAAGLLDAVGLRDMIGGKIYNPTLSILKNNGYRIEYIQPSNYNFTDNNYLDYYCPASRIYDSLLIFQNPIINQLYARLANLQNPNRRSDLTYSDQNEFYQILHAVIDSTPEFSQPTFYFIKESLEVVHTPIYDKHSWRPSDANWVDIYIEKVKNSNPKIMETVNRIIKKDPEAIMILYGDHGALKYRRVWTDIGDKRIDEIIYEREKISMDELALDNFGVFTALRYPNGDPSILDGTAYVNLFRVLFSNLSGDESPLPNQENDSFLKDSGKTYKIVDDGRVLEKAELIK